MNSTHLTEWAGAPTGLIAPAETNREAALRYAARNWAVFPVAPFSKKPIAGSNGVSEATTDPETIRRWWAATPDANIGIACGKSGIIAIDVDVKTGGLVSMAALVEQYGDVPDTVEAVTPTGGRHFIFQQPAAPVGNRVGAWPGIDIRANEGYVVASPSAHPTGGQYEWREGHSPWDIQPATVPPWLVPPPKPQTKKLGEAPLFEGERNAGLTRLAGGLRSQGLDEAALYEALRALNARLCTPPLDDSEVRSIAASIASRPGGVGQRPPRAFRILSREALNQLPAVEWLVDGILPVGGLGVLYGPSGGGKTFTALSMAFAIGTGTPWLGRGTRPGRVVYVAAEGRSGLRARVEALEAHNGLPAGELHVVPEAVQISRPDEVEALIAAIRTQLPDDPSLIVVDTLARCLVGLDENLARDVGLFVAGLDRLREEFGCSILVVHHSGKDRASSYRGSSALVGAADSVIRFEGSGGLLTLSCEKVKDGEAFAAINAQLLTTGDSCVVVPSAPKSPAAPATLTLVATAASLGSDWIPRSELAKASGLPLSTFYKALAGAVRLELLEQDGEGRAKRLRVKLAEATE